jgi:hypothetical protein
MLEELVHDADHNGGCNGEVTACGVAARRSRGASLWSDSSRRRRSSRHGSHPIPTAKIWDRSWLRRRPRIGAGLAPIFPSLCRHTKGLGLRKLAAV